MDSQPPLQDRALRPLRVLEVGEDVAVRYLGRLFGQFGAEVVRLAPPGRDAAIGYAGRCGEAYGRWLDERKAIADWAQGGFDLVIGGLTAEAVAEAGELRARHGGVLVGLSWFDPAGPYGKWQASDEIINALAGVAYAFGEQAGPPTPPQGHAPQLTAAVVAFNAALAALLFEPARRPRRVDVNVLEAALCYAETGAVTCAKTGARSVRLGVNRFVPTYPCSPYRAADGWVGVTCLTPAQWKALCRLIERPDLAEDPRFATAYQRLMIAEEVDAALSPAFRGRSRQAWVELGIAHRIPIAPMLRPGELPSSAHWRARNAFAAFDDSGALAPAMPYRMIFDGVCAPAGGAGDGEGPLVGLRVADFSMGWAGPLCARTLADLGADVVKVESETHPDWWRGWDSGSVDVVTRESQLNFINVNRNKRGVDFDLTQPAGLARAKALIAGADVVVENYAAGVLAKLGLGKAVQQALRPGVITLSMPAFGSDGPLSGLRAYGSTVEQASGLPFVNGEAGWVPSQQHVALGDPIAGLYAASAVLAALHARERLGGADIDLAQVACLFQLGADAIIAEQVTGAPVARTGRHRPRLALCAVAASRNDDEWVAVTVADHDALRCLAELVGGEGREVLEAWIAERAAAEAVAALQRAGIAAAPVNPPHALCGDPHLAALGYFLPMERPFVGAHLVGASPFRFDGERPALRRPAPLLGEHTEEVLAELGAQAG